MTLRIRRGLEADRKSIIPAEGELLFTTDKKRLFVGDSTTAGGKPVLDISEPLVADLPRFERILTTTSVNAGSFVVGHNYRITFVGSTNFIAIGASANTVGLTFTATGVGTGSGTATSFGTSASLSLNTSLKLAKRVPGTPDIAYNFGGPAINFYVQAGDGATLTTDQTVALFGTYYQGAGTTYNHSFQFSLLNAGSGGSYDGVLNLSRLKADFDVPFKPQTFADTAARDAHYVTFTEPDADPEEGDMIYITLDSGNKPRLQVYNNSSWQSLVTRRFAFTDGGVGPTFTREQNAVEDGTSALRLIRRRTDDTVNTNDRIGPSLRFDWAYGAGITNETQFAFVNTNYKGTTSDHEIVFSTTPDNGSNFDNLMTMSRKKITFFEPAKLVVYADTTARSAGVPSPEAGMMIYLTSTNKAQVYNGSAWQDLN